MDMDAGCDKNLTHAIIAEIKRIASELGHPPTYSEYFKSKDRRFSERQIRRLFGGYVPLLHACGFTSVRLGNGKKADKPKEFKYKPEKIQGFFRHTLDLDELFKRAGNPTVLKMIAQPDTHGKYHDPDAIKCFLSFCKYYNPDIHMIMGDFADMEGISHWPQDSLEPRRLVPEMLECRQLLQRIVDNTPRATTRLYLGGNHEAWLDQAIAFKLPELFDGIEELGVDVSLNSLLSLDKFGYTLYPMNHLVRIGKAHFTHGIFTGDNHAKKHLETFKANIYYGHLHDTKSHNATSMDGPLEAQSLGCLCRLDAKFLKGRPNNWVHALGCFEIFPDGNYTFIYPKIINGKMSYNGIIFPTHD